MFYHLLYIHLYRPFLKYTRSNSPLPPHVSPRKLCVQAAVAISKLLRIYKRAYGLKQIVNVAVYIAHTACTIHLLNLPEADSQRDIVHGLKNLEEMGEGWLCARRTIRILEISANKWQVPVPNEAMSVFERTHAKWGSWGSWDQVTSSPSPVAASDMSPSTVEASLHIGGGSTAARSKPTEQYMPAVAASPDTAWASQMRASPSEVLNTPAQAYYDPFISTTSPFMSSITSSAAAPLATSAPTHQQAAANIQRRMVQLPEPTYLRPMSSVSYAYQSMPFSQQDIWYNGGGQESQVNVPSPSAATGMTTGGRVEAPSMDMVSDGGSRQWWNPWPVSVTTEPWDPNGEAAAAAAAMGATGDMPVSMATPFDMSFRSNVTGSDGVGQQDSGDTPSPGVGVGVWQPKH